jgi:hypothetical protein
MPGEAHSTPPLRELSRELWAAQHLSLWDWAGDSDICRCRMGRTGGRNGGNGYMRLVRGGIDAHDHAASRLDPALPTQYRQHAGPELYSDSKTT